MAHVISVIRPTPAGVEKSMYSGEVSPLEVQDFCLGEFPGFKNLLEKCMFFILSGIVIAFARLIKKKKKLTLPHLIYVYTIILAPFLIIMLK